MTDEAEETERLRQELASAREEAEGLLAAERDETARLRQELADRPAPAEDGEADQSGRRMYERISHELERERATVQALRRELDAKQTDTAEKRRTKAAAATNGVTATDEAPVPVTPAGRGARQAARAAVAARAGEADQRAPYRRAEAARAAAAHRVPEAEPSATRVWVARAVAIALVTILLVALAIIVTALA
jgi:hypothetical protein